MSDQRGVARQKVIDAQTSAASGTNVRATVIEVTDPSGRVIPLSIVDELFIYVHLTVALVGTSPTMNLYLQRAVVPDPDPTVDADWTDFYAFFQITTSLSEFVATIPVYDMGYVSNSPGANQRNRVHATLAANTQITGHWGDRIRIVEKMGGTVTTQAVYDVVFTAIVRN